MLSQNAMTPLMDTKEDALIFARRDRNRNYFGAYVDTEITLVLGDPCHHEVRTDENTSCKV